MNCCKPLKLVFIFQRKFFFVSDKFFHSNFCGKSNKNLTFLTKLFLANLYFFCCMTTVNKKRSISVIFCVKKISRILDQINVKTFDKRPAFSIYEIFQTAEAFRFSGLSVPMQGANFKKTYQNIFTKKSKMLRCEDFIRQFWSEKYFVSEQSVIYGFVF